jgi:Fic-DOC domain mobile mystery protein B
VNGRRFINAVLTLTATTGVAIRYILFCHLQAIDDARYWIEHKSCALDELAIRFHHKAVLVHPFPNGNGRWSRLAADLLVTRQAGTRFSWGGANLQTAGDARRAYIDALQAADNHDLGPLVTFARS